MDPQRLLPAMVVDNAKRAQAAERAGLRPRKWSRPWQVAAHSAQVDLFPPGLFAEAGILVDVGAFEGHWTDAMLVLAPDRSAVLVEATPSAAASLRSRFAFDSRVVVHPVAAAAEDGSATLHVFTAGNFNSLLPSSDDLQAWYDVEEQDT